MSDRVSSQALRVDDKDNALARVVLETHYFGDCEAYLPTSLSKKWNNWLGGRGCGIGPFVAIQPGEDRIIDAIGAGLMWGFRRSIDNPEDQRSFNIGLGFMVDPDATVLGAGIEENESLPAGETSPRTREKAQFSFLVMTSFAFN